MILGKKISVDCNFRHFIEKNVYIVFQSKFVPLTFLSTGLFFAILRLFFIIKYCGFQNLSNMSYANCFEQCILFVVKLQLFMM